MVMTPRVKSDLYLLGETSAKELGLELGHQSNNPLTIMFFIHLFYGSIVLVAPPWLDP